MFEMLGRGKFGYETSKPRDHSPRTRNGGTIVQVGGGGMREGMTNDLKWEG